MKGRMGDEFETEPGFYSQREWISHQRVLRRQMPSFTLLERPLQLLCGGCTALGGKSKGDN